MFEAFWSGSNSVTSNVRCVLTYSLVCSDASSVVWLALMLALFAWKLSLLEALWSGFSYMLLLMLETLWSGSNSDTS